MFSQNNNQFYCLPSGVKTLDILPSGIYDLLRDSNDNLFLSRSESKFTLPKKMYGNTISHRNRILKKYDSRVGSNTGILASGNKGSGKSLLAKDLGSSIISRENGVVINVALKATGSEFAQILQNIKQPCMVLLDEFEKIYAKEDQEKMLSVMDGGLTTNILFVITANNVYKLDEHMINRPGRIFYHIKYKGLDADFIEEYCEDKLDNKDFLPNILRTSSIIEDMNFDMLQAIVGELNIFPELKYSEMMEIMNISASKVSNKGKYIFELVEVGGRDVRGKYTIDINSNPMNENVYVGFSLKEKSSDDDLDSDSIQDDEDDNDDDSPSYVNFSNSDWDLVYITDPPNVEFGYVHKTKNYKVIVTKELQKERDPFLLMQRNSSFV